MLNVWAISTEKNSSRLSIRFVCNVEGSMCVRLCSTIGVVGTYVHSLVHNSFETPSLTRLTVWHWDSSLLVWPGYSYFPASICRDGGSHSSHLTTTVTTTGQIEVRWISAISSCCTSRYVAGDDITRDRPGEKYPWLMYVRQRNKWISCKVRSEDYSSAPFEIVLKCSITNRMTSIVSFCIKHNTLSVTQYRTFLYLLVEFLFL